MASVALERLEESTWHPLQATLSSSDASGSTSTSSSSSSSSSSNATRLLYVKFLGSNEGYDLAVTDLVHVWSRTSDLRELTHEREVRLTPRGALQFIRLNDRVIR